ncbi:MAG: acetyl-CoA C-acetyltransferase, partial [Pseudomonadota bacterium]
MAEAYIIDAVRTPRGIGKVGKGALAASHPQHLGATVLKAIAERNSLDTSTIDDVIFSVSTQDGPQGGDLGRMAALDAGYDITSSGTTLDRFCGGGITSVALASAQVMSGMEDCVVAGGTEMMSLTAEMAKAKMQAGIPGPMMGSHNERLQAKHPQSHQGICGDAIATIEGFTREELDEVGYRSQQRAAVAIEEGRFDKSVVPVLDDDGSVILDREEYPRPQTTLEGLAELQPAFVKIADVPLDKNGTTFRGLINQKYPDVDIQHFHHAGNSSGVVDGAAAVLICSKEYAQKNGLKPRARIVQTANMGDDPTLMLNAPVPAAKKVLEKAGMTKDDIDLYEINEAFAVVAAKFVKDLDLDWDKVNVNG